MTAGIRFAETGLDRRQAVWRTLCDAYFSKLIPKDAAVLVHDFLGRDYNFQAYRAWLDAA